VVQKEGIDEGKHRTAEIKSKQEKLRGGKGEARRRLGGNKGKRRNTYTCNGT